MNFPIEVIDTKLGSEELYYKAVYLPYMFTRTDDPPCEGRPEVDERNNYWTHQLYNFCPVDNPTYYQNSGLKASEDPLYLEVLTYLEAICPQMPKREWLYSSYINVLRHGNTPGVHVDAPYDVPENKTVLLYLNYEWHPNWGGETIFYDHNLDAQRIVTPKPGRVVMFDGRIPHTGRPPTPRYMMNRYIITFKYMEPSIRQGLFTDYDVKNKKPVEDKGVLGFDSKTVRDLLLT